MKKIVFLLLISLGVHAQTKIKYSQMENPATSSVNLGTQTFSVSTITGSVTIGTGTVAANTSSLGIVRIKQGSSFLDFGESSTGFAGLWINAATTSSTNYVLNSDYNNVRLNAPNGDLLLRVGNANRMSLGVSNSYHTLPLSIGTTSSPSKTLDVTGNGAFTQSLSINTGSATTIIGSQIGTSSISAIYCGTATPSSTNYVLNNNGGSTAINGISNANLNVNGVNILNGYSSGVAITGILTATGASTITGNTTVGGLTTAGNITTTGSGSLTIAPNYARLGNLYLNTVATNTLVTGNTGTVAVLSDAVFSIDLCEGESSPADATTYYIGQGCAAPSSSPSNGIVYLPYNCTLVGWSYSGTVKSVVATAGSSTLSAVINGTNSVSLSTSITHTIASGYNNFQGTGLSTSLTAGDYINCSLLTPSWATNPTDLYTGITLWFVRRQ